MKTVGWVLLATLAFVISSTAGPGRAEAPNPKAPEQTSQYSFLIGSWECKTKFMGPDRSYTEGRATWSAEYILDGWAIQDYWVSERPDGTRVHGTNIRSFNPQTGKWDNRWLAQGNLQWKQFESSQVGENMVMIGGRGRDPNGEFVDRNTFHDIAEDRWLWRKDRSYDGGETWIEGIGFIEATRAKVKKKTKAP